MGSRESQGLVDVDWTVGAGDVMPLAPVPSRAVRFFAPRCSEAWVQAAAKLPGKGLQVALVVLHLQRLGKCQEVKVSPSMLAAFGVSRQAGYRGVDALAAAGLVGIVERRVGRAVVVRVLEKAG